MPKVMACLTRMGSLPLCVYLLLLAGRFYALKQGSRIFHSGGPANLQLRWSPDPELWTRWSTGTTGMPLVDANMRELQQTGESAEWAGELGQPQLVTAWLFASACRATANCTGGVDGLVRAKLALD